ncbi:long-chain fatty acid transport protein [Panacagrimonas perspica]|uniref:Long-chain fatty acid transport protein n=1 Tax=Panacagrimonas perspica TaxID=381431 RepID=A0A4S3K2A1_9GAMM|nr:outer membrane protein transport protein [Panacagrimonas perspica]TDU26492.1 long-chain fatty acid transport protein [Panacagrimonas perspica]THD02107.1 hypothetical protein B1810_16660 [Panacagrimonas perspica]
MKSIRFALIPIAMSCAVPSHATIGLFEHGNGVKSLGMGGVGYSFAEESMGLAANPAHAQLLGSRYDLGVDMFIAEAVASHHDNAAGPDAEFKSDGREFYYIPQAGFVKRLSDRWAVGATMLSAGLGADYDGSPYARFGGAGRTNLTLASSSLATALAYRIAPTHTAGIGINLGYQVLAAKGLEFLANSDSSVAPSHVTNQGKDGAFNVGLSAGWHAQFNPWLAAGLGYRSKNMTERHKDYRGLVAEGGRLELPAIFGGGITLTPRADWTISMEAQRFDYRKQRAFRNGLSRFTEAKLGSDTGPGFGYNDQEAYKFGVRWQAHPRLAIRAGYVHATQVIDESETFFAPLGPLTPTDHYTAGATWSVAGWELSGYGFDAGKKTVRGRGSIPDALGGGEADISNKMFGFGVAIGRRL